MEKHTNIGGLDGEDYSVYNHYLLSKLAGDESISGLVSVNYHLFGLEEGESDTSVEMSMEALDEMFESKYEIFAYYSEGKYVIKLPVFESSYEYIYNLCEKDLLDMIIDSIEVQ